MEYEKFCSLIHDLLPEEQEILPDKHLSSDLGICSFDMMMLIFQIEELSEHKVEISEIKKDMTVRDFFGLFYK